MKNRVRSISVVSLLVVSLCLPTWLLAQSGGRKGGRASQGKPAQSGRQGGQQGSMQGGPPQQALNACQSKQDGDSCQFQSPRGTISGTCQSIQNQMACVPEGMGPGGSQGGQQQGQQMPGGGQQRSQRQQNAQTFAPFTNAKSVPNTLVDTGQNRCYNARQEIACPAEGEAFYGQDAAYTSKAPAYRDNGDGTVTDLNTGLMWQQDPGDKMTYNRAVKKASSFNLAGYTDWRLPTIKELYSLILFSGIDVGPQTTGENGVPFIDTNYFEFEYGDTSAGERIIDAQYASATKYVGTTMNGNETMFGVNFADGRIKGYGITDPRSRSGKTFFVLYVRGNTGYGTNDFRDNGNGTITDSGTGLMWMQADSGTGMVWEDALGYCENLEYAGDSDWRLPNAKELQSIVDYGRSPATTNSAAIDPVFSTSAMTDEGGKPNYPFYWTSTTHANERGGGNGAYIAFGEALGWMKFRTGNTATLLDVHGAGAQRSDPKTGDAGDYAQGHGPQGDVFRITNYVRCLRN